MLAGAACLGISPLKAQSQPSGEPNKIGGEAALARLMEGNARYVADKQGPSCNSACRSSLTQSQHPIAVMLSCSDSRVSPELIFDQEPGEIFVIRIAGNVIDTDILASLEFAVEELKVPLIMVMGHSGCGAVTAALKVARDKITVPGHLKTLVGQIRPAVKEAARASGDELADAIIVNARMSAQKIAGSQAILGPAIANGSAKLVTSVYDLASGRVSVL
ncbi:carbonic anhydrase [Aquabacter sp. CN5-332]|uniref:carbonic anhydrase n=1 Tax=Aquabacter sp. CN5-332 TaxID=3156608 RepID=UPI0032B41FF9